MADDALEVLVAQDVIDELNAQVWSKSFMAELAFAPTDDLPDLGELRCDVVPMTSDRDVGAGTVSTDGKEIGVSIGFRKLLDDPSSPNRELREMMLFGEAVEDHFADWESDPYGRVSRIRREPMLDPRHLRRNNVIVMAILLVFDLQVQS